MGDQRRALGPLHRDEPSRRCPTARIKVTALVCTPDMEGIDIFEKNRSKCGIRGTWQARIKLHQDVRVPKFNLMHKEGRGPERRADLPELRAVHPERRHARRGAQAGDGPGRSSGRQTRYQFGRPARRTRNWCRERVAHMAALTYAMDSVLYMTTGMLDREDQDIMVETAICKVVLLGDGLAGRQRLPCRSWAASRYMTENEHRADLPRQRASTSSSRDRQRPDAESFVFAYGGKQLGEWMLGVQRSGADGQVLQRHGACCAADPASDRWRSSWASASRRKPVIAKVHESLRAPIADRLCPL